MIERPADQLARSAPARSGGTDAPTHPRLGLTPRSIQVVPVPQHNSAKGWWAVQAHHLDEMSTHKRGQARASGAAAPAGTWRARPSASRARGQRALDSRRIGCQSRTAASWQVVRQRDQAIGKVQRTAPMAPPTSSGVKRQRRRRRVNVRSPIASSNQRLHRGLRPPSGACVQHARAR